MKLLPLLCLLVSLLSISTLSIAESQGQVRVQLSGLANVEGAIYVSVYDSEETWLGDEKVLEKKVVIEEARQGDKVVTDLQLSPGEYALTVYYDTNANSKLDRNFFGLPKEPVALSNNARPRFGPPKYRDAKFIIAGTLLVQQLVLEVP